MTGTSTDTISLTSTGSNNIAVDAAVSTGSGSITANSGAAISESGSLSTTGLLTATAVSGVTLNGRTRWAVSRPPTAPAGVLISPTPQRRWRWR